MTAILVITVVLNTNIATVYQDGTGGSAVAGAEATTIQGDAVTTDVLGRHTVAARCRATGVAEARVIGGITGTLRRRRCIGSKDRGTEMSTGAVAASSGKGLRTHHDSTDESAAKHPEGLTPGHAAGEGLGEFIPLIGHVLVLPFFFSFFQIFVGRRVRHEEASK